jgi:glutaconate CoA-transferase subunit B
VLTELHPGCTVEQAVEATGWPLRVADSVGRTAPPTATELDALAVLKAA